MRLFVAAVAAIIVLAFGGYFFFFHKAPAGGPPAASAPYAAPALTKSYKNDQYNFSLMMPGDFTAQELPADENGAQTVALQNASGDGVQITITPFDEDLAVLSKERIAQDVPDLKISDEQPVEIGANHTGLAFKSDNAAFGGASREVWFVFRGNLYQISTYERLDPLLKAIFATWQFF